VKIIEELIILEAGTDMLKQDHNGETPLHIACKRGCAGDIIGLAKFNPPLLIKNKDGKTLLE